jgi:hypothetical protein
VVDPARAVGTFASLALDDSDHAHIAYYDYGNVDLKYAAWNGTSWDIQAADATGEVGTASTLKMDSSGQPHITYLISFNDVGFDLVYAVGISAPVDQKYLYLPVVSRR